MSIKLTLVTKWQSFSSASVILSVRISGEFTDVTNRQCQENCDTQTDGLMVEVEK